ncbi:hypothetical protein SprV_0501747600 [Sparganum proliferum]
MAIKFREQPVWRSTTDTINSKVFVNIVRGVFDYNDIHGHRLDIIILHDNAPVHRPKETTASPSACELRSIFISANSPDLNPIGNLFALIKRHWHEANKKSSMHEKT